MKQYIEEQKLLNTRAGMKTPKTNLDLDELPKAQTAEVIFDKMERFFSRSQRA